MGRKAQAPALKLLGGRSPGRDSGGRKVAPPPPFVRRAPEPPDFLDGEALAEWHRVVPGLERLGLLHDGSRAGLAAYCVAWSTFRIAAAAVAEGGVYNEASDHGGRNPATVVLAGASKELRAWCVEFGMTPSAEGRMKVPDTAEGTDDFDA